MKPFYVSWGRYIGFDDENNDIDLNFKVGNQKQISKYKNVFGNDQKPNWLEESFAFRKIRNTLPWTYVIEDLN